MFARTAFGGPSQCQRSARRRAWAILEHIVPPPIRRIANPHVVRDHIHQESHAVLGERVRERFQVRLRAELRVDGAMVRHIVAMETTRRALKKGEA